MKSFKPKIQIIIIKKPQKLSIFPYTWRISVKNSWFVILLTAMTWNLTYLSILDSSLRKKLKVQNGGAILFLKILLLAQYSFFRFEQHHYFWHHRMLFFPIFCTIKKQKLCDVYVINDNALLISTAWAAYYRVAIRVAYTLIW